MVAGLQSDICNFAPCDRPDAGNNNDNNGEVMKQSPSFSLSGLSFLHNTGLIATATILASLLSGCEDQTALDQYKLSADNVPSDSSPQEGSRETSAQPTSPADTATATNARSTSQVIQKSPRANTSPASALNTSYDTSFETSRGLRLGKGAAFDSSERFSGARSIYLNSPGDNFTAASVPVTEDQWYMISGFMKLDSNPKPITNILIKVYDKNGRWAYNAADYTFSISANQEWEEFIVPVYILSGFNAGSLQINIRYKENPSSREFVDANIWIDDLKVIEADDSSAFAGFNAPEPREPFTGNKTRVDALGNWEIFRNGEWETFFPLAIYPDFSENDWSKYFDKGFNTVSQIKNPGGANRAREAGLMWMWDITDYLYSADAFPGSNPSTGDVAKLERQFQDFATDTGFKDMLSYYWDNEDLNEWDSVKQITTRLKALDRSGSANGKQSFPIYMNSMHMIANPLFMNDDYHFIDLQGCYINPIINPHTGGYQAEWAMFLAADRMQGIKSPTGLGIINVPHEGDHIEPLIFAGIARGMRGFSFWRDSYAGKSEYEIENRAWWSTFDQTAEKINDMLPLIRQPHWTDWKLESSIPEREDTLVVGKRDLEGRRHIILASLSDHEQTVTLTTDQVVNEIRDYFTGEIVTTPESNRFSITIEAHGTAVLMLELRD